MLIMRFVLVISFSPTYGIDTAHELLFSLNSITAQWTLNNFIRMNR